MVLIDKNDLIKRMSIGAPMNWTDTDRELGEESQFKSDMLTIQCCQEVPAIPIPAKATNGDMIKTLFPNTIISEDCGNVYIKFNDDIKVFRKYWWNAPYKAESEVEE